MTKFLNISTDTTLGGASPSDETVSSQKAIKAYVDNVSLDDLKNITITNPTAGQNLTYDAVNQVWKNTSTSATVAWGGITGTLSDQTDLNTALSGKQATITGAATTITSNNLSAARALVSDSTGKVAVSTVTSTELGYMHGVTSAVQTQLNNKQATLVSGTNIKTINGTSILGSGDITISSAPDIDNSTITKNGSDQLQAVATVNANTAAGATNPVYDWVGTLAEYTNQAVATNHPDWVCYITDDCEATAYQAYTQSQCNNLFVQKGHQVIEFQEPTAANNYTWYRKYADGWVEQGGYVAAGNGTTANFPITMADNNYLASFMFLATNLQVTYTGFQATDRTTASMKVYGFYNNGSGRSYISEPMRWKIEGMAA